MLGGVGVVLKALECCDDSPRLGLDLWRGKLVLIIWTKVRRCARRHGVVGKCLDVVSWEKICTIVVVLNNRLLGRIGWIISQWNGW